MVWGRSPCTPLGCGGPARTRPCHLGTAPVIAGESEEDGADPGEDGVTAGEVGREGFEGGKRVGGTISTMSRPPMQTLDSAYPPCQTGGQFDRRPGLCPPLIPQSRVWVASRKGGMGDTPYGWRATGTEYSRPHSPPVAPPRKDHETDVTPFSSCLEERIGSRRDILLAVAVNARPICLKAKAGLIRPASSRSRRIRPAPSGLGRGRHSRSGR